MSSRLERIARALLGDRPRALALLAAPTALGVAIDLALRARTLAGFALQGKAIYASSVLVSAAFWIFPLLLAARARRAIVIAFLVAWVLPIATFAFGGQALYFGVFHAYMGRDTVRLGIALRGTVGDWLLSWGGPGRLAFVVVVGALVTAAVGALVRRASAPAAGRLPLLPALTFAGAVICFLTDNVDSRFLQAATPDACFVHGAVRALRVAITGEGRLHQGMAVRTPAPLPKLASARARPPNVVVVLTESVRADALCSAPPPQCRTTFLDEVAADRVSLGRLTTQTPSTFSACMILWTGLSPNVDFKTAHTAPVLWEVARAAGYVTAYVTSQNTSYENFGAFVQRAGIDHLVVATDLGGVAQEHLGAPDERAFADGLAFARGAGERPYFAVVHLSNTHAPYRTDPALRPFTPDSDDPFGEASAFHNRYKNSVLMEERAIGAFMRDLRALPSWDDTTVVVLSDHGEQFREHDRLYHNHSLFDVDLRVPGFLVAGARALGDEQRAGLASYVDARTYMQDVHATLVDLFGVDRAAIPLDDPLGRSLVRARPAEEPFVLLATTTAVWEPDDALLGAIAGDRKVVGDASGAWSCFDVARDPSETTRESGAWCDDMIARAKGAFHPPPR